MTQLATQTYERDCIQSIVSIVQYSDRECFYYSEAVCASSSLCSCQPSTTNRTFPLQDGGETTISFQLAHLILSLGILSQLMVVSLQCSHGRRRINRPESFAQEIVCKSKSNIRPSNFQNQSAPLVLYFLKCLLPIFSMVKCALGKVTIRTPKRNVS